VDKELTKTEISFIGQLLAAISVESFRKLLTDHILNAFIVSHNNTNIEFNFGGSKPDPNTIDYIKEREIILSDKTASKLEGDLKYELITALQNNESISQITRRLDKIFTDMMPWQLERIARSEVIDAQNAGRISAYKASDVVEYKMWIAAKGGKGERVCDLCASMHGQIRPVDKPFVNPNNSTESWQHPICHPNGRCTTVPLMDLPDDVIIVNGLTYAADKKLGKVEININSLNKSDNSVNKVEINSGLLNKKEIRVEGFWDKKGRWHKPHKRRIRDKSSEKVSEEVIPNDNVIGEESTSMTPENLKELKSFEDLGMFGGIHESGSYCAKFTDDTNAMYKVMNEGAIVGEVSTYDISRVLNWNVIPETTKVNLKENGNGSCQRWVEGGRSPYGGSDYDEDCHVIIDNRHFGDLSKIFVLDMLSGNYDRHGGNVMIDKDDHCWAIDNEDWGTTGSADDFMTSLDDRADVSDVSGFSPMIRWLDKNLGVTDYLIFREKVIENMKQVVDNKDEIINYYDKYRDNDLVIGEEADEKSITLVLLCIKQNLDYIEKYCGENK
jgi:SPP1 gp7 family putative phage head morphogenesis protein